MMPLSPREKELTARHLLAHPEEIPVWLKDRKWRELAALVEFAGHDASPSLAQTDPALYRLLRRQITEFHLRGWSCLNLASLRKLAGDDLATDGR
jgi:hypothetical protein